MINLITQEVLRQMKAMQGSTSSVGSVKAQGSENGILLSDMRPGAKVSDVKQLFAAARQNNSFAVCIPQWFVSVAKENLVGSTIKIATVVGLPGGTNSPFAKYAEIKQAVAAGADIILVPTNADMCRTGNVKGVQKDLAESLTASKKKAVSGAIVEVNGLDRRGLAEICSGCNAVGADVVVLSTITGGTIDVEVIKELKSKGIKVGVMGGASDASARQTYRNAGAEWFVVRR